MNIPRQTIKRIISAFEFPEIYSALKILDASHREYLTIAEINKIRQSVSHCLHQNSDMVLPDLQALQQVFNNAVQIMVPA